MARFAGLKQQGICKVAGFANPDFNTTLPEAGHFRSLEALLSIPSNSRRTHRKRGAGTAEKKDFGVQPKPLL